MFQIGVKLLKYSQSRDSGKRIATFVVTIPKFIQAHINAHRALSKNSASSRAIPAKILRERVIKYPVVPIEFSENKPGMRGGDSLSRWKKYIAKRIWLFSRFFMCTCHYFFEKLNVHKEVTNRLIEPWLFVEVIVTATEWNNFIMLRKDNAAQPEIQIIAQQIESLLNTSTPEIINDGEWHLPFISEDEKSIYTQEELLKMSVARCARVSYKLFDGTNSDIKKDFNLCEKLINQGHWSPFEHIAKPGDVGERSGNFVGWVQYRKRFENENGGDY